jgi:hypothetical protein
MARYPIVCAFAVLLAACGSKSMLDEAACEPSQRCASALADAGSPPTDAARSASDSSSSVADASDGAAPVDSGPVVVASTEPCLGAQGNVIYLDGDPDDPVHPGAATYTFPVSAEACGAYMSTPAELGMGCPSSFGSDTAEIGFFFRTADGRPLKLATYENALSTDRVPGYPFLSVRAQGAYGGQCDDYSIGRFQIEQLDLDSRGQAKEVLISFEQHCTLHLGALRGCVHYVKGSP